MKFLLLSLSLFAHLSISAEAVIFYRLDKDADTITFTGSASGAAEFSVIEWNFSNSSSTADADFLALELIGGGFDPTFDVFLIEQEGVTTEINIGGEFFMPPTTIEANDAIFSYASQSTSAQQFIEQTLDGNEIVLITGTGFGNIVPVVPEPSSAFLVALCASMAVFRRSRNHF